MSKKDIKIRKNWPSDMDPSTKIHKVKTDYNRSKHGKKEIEDALLDAEEENIDLNFDF
jgi:hypothetical protein